MLCDELMEARRYGKIYLIKKCLTGNRVIMQRMHVRKGKVLLETPITKRLHCKMEVQEGDVAFFPNCRKENGQCQIDIYRGPENGERVRQQAE